MLGSTELTAALNVPGVTGLLNDWTDDAGNTRKALFAEMVAPDAFHGDKYITFYASAIRSPGESFGKYEFIVNCRAKTFSESLAIAQAVIQATSRKGGAGFFTICDLNQTVPPMDDTDDYNTPVIVRVKTRG